MNRVSRVAIIRPPTTTVARLRCTSVPTPVARAAGIMPTVATVAVISTGPETLDCTGEHGFPKRRPLLAHSPDVCDHDDAVLYSHTKQGDEADSAGDIESLTGKAERDQPAQGGERHRAQNQQRLAQLAELGKQKHQHKRQHEPHYQSQPRLGALRLSNWPPYSI